MYVHDEQEIKKGEVFGLIRFASINGIWLAVCVVPQVYVGQAKVAGEIVLCYLSQKESKPSEFIIIL